MIRVTPFRPDDALELLLQPAQALAWHERTAIAARFAAAGNAFTLRDDAGTVMFCGGAVEQHAPIEGVGGHAQLWGLFALGKRHGLLALRRMTRQFIASLPHARVDAAVDDTPAARRWAVLAGLVPDVVLADAAPGGGDLHIYRRIK
jgi:hypothetical protein